MTGRASRTFCVAGEAANFCERQCRILCSSVSL